ncbi:MAG: DUF2797 domain-containing protein [Chromatiales bacterium]|nr:DUF2797 domain-containing protein [Chromatiales bacterium]
MSIAGDLRKLKSELDEPVRYRLPLGEERLELNPLIGKTLHLHHEGEIHCIGCGRPIKKSLQQGYCYPCTQRLAECDICIVKPELCHYDAGTCREPQWGESHCMQPHVVYLANSSALKVGITRAGQIPTRWIDQGASQALPILKVASRYISGLVEDAMKAHVSDRTDWRAMLKGDPQPLDLTAERDRLLGLIGDALEGISHRFGEDAVQRVDAGQVQEIRYPIEVYPKKISSLNLDKTPTVGGTLVGIKGQYLIFDTGVINMRKYQGYRLAVSLSA